MGVQTERHCESFKIISNHNFPIKNPFVCLYACPFVNDLQLEQFDQSSIFLAWGPNIREDRVINQFSENEQTYSPQLSDTV